MNGWALAIVWAAVFVLLVVASGFFTGLSATLIAVSRFRLRYGPDHEGGPRVRRVLTLFDNAQRVQAVSIIGSTLTGVAALIAAIFLFREILQTTGRPLDRETAVIAWIVAVPLLLIFGKVVPQRLLRKLDNRIIFVLYHPIRWSLRFLGGLGEAGIWLARQATRGGGLKELPADLLAPGEPWQSLLEPVPEPTSTTAAAEIIESQMIHGIFNLEKTRAREVMKPLVDLVVVHLPERVGAVRELARQTGYSRFPVYRDRITNLTGYLDIYDILAAEPADDRPADSYAREVLYVPETKRLDSLLQKLLHGRHKVAIAVDEYGGCSGWVTREDLLEEIVGEIEDEFDEAAEPIRQLDRRSWRVRADVHIDDLNAHIGLRLPSLEFDTLGGFVYDTLGRVPQVGDSFVDNEVRYELLEMDNRRIVSVEITRPSGLDTPSTPTHRAQPGIS